jgi:hypothetical protein
MAPTRLRLPAGFVTEVRKMAQRWNAEVSALLVRTGAHGVRLRVSVERAGDERAQEEFWHQVPPAVREGAPCD